MEPAKIYHRTELRTTLCGSEVPQDRWRGRTAGSGMSVSYTHLTLPTIYTV